MYKKETHWYFAEEETDLTDLQSVLETLSADSFIAEKTSGKEEIVLTADTE